MRTLALYVMLFGLTTISLGIVGFLSAEDTFLLGSCLVAGIVLIGTGLRLQKGWRPGLLTGLIVSLVMTGYFGMIFFEKDGTFIPSGLLAVMAVLSVLLTLLIMVQPKERKREF